MMDTLPSLIITFQANGACQSLSRQWIDYTGRREAEQLGFRWLEQVHVDDRRRVSTEWDEALKKNKRLSTLLRLQQRNGANRRFRLDIVPVLGPDGSITRWYGSAREAEDVD